MSNPNTTSEPIQLYSDRLNVFEDVAINFTDLPPEAISDETNQTETESFGSVAFSTPSILVTVPEVPAPPKSV